MSLVDPALLIGDRHIRALETKWRNIANDVAFIDETASVAYFRLMHITRQDRAACGDGRWVKTWRCHPWIGDKPITPEFIVRSFYDRRRRYRWEPRR